MSELEKIAEEIRACTLCGLAKGRTQAVPGDGNPNAAIMFVGEGPGFHEDKQGLPFVGASGHYLEGTFRKIGLQREDVFITNVVRCRPPQNRDPLRPELEACADYLDRQIAVIRPRLIATLGRFSMARWFPNEKITAIHGKPKYQDGRIYYPLFHPAAVLRNPTLRPVMEDFQRMKQLIDDFDKYMEEAKDSPPPDEPPPPPPPQQLSLF